MSRQTPPRCRAAAFTMVEIIVAIAVVAVMFVAVLNTVGTTRSTLFTIGDRARAHAIADDLMQEILTQAYRDPDVPSSFGPTAEEAATGDRSLFNDVDDYHGWRASPPEDRTGVALSRHERFSRAVDVTWVDSNLQPAADDTGLKRITVTVSRADTVFATLVAYRSDALRTEAAP